MGAPSSEAVPPFYTHAPPAGAPAFEAGVPAYAHAQPAVAPPYQAGVPAYAPTKADGAPAGEGEVPAFAQAQPAGTPGQPVIVVQQVVSAPPAAQQQNVNVSVSQVQTAQVPVLYFIGLGWLLFVLGFPTLGITWIVGACMLFCVKDERDRPGFIACAVATVILVIIVIASAASNR